MAFVPPFTQIAPRWVHRNNQLNLLDPKPALDPLLAPDSVAHIVKALVINKTINLVALAELRSVPKLVLPNPPMEAVRNADIETLGAVGQNVNAVATVLAELHRSFAPLSSG